MVRVRSLKSGLLALLAYYELRHYNYVSPDMLLSQYRPSSMIYRVLGRNIIERNIVIERIECKESLSIQQWLNDQYNKLLRRLSHDLQQPYQHRGLAIARDTQRFFERIRNLSAQYSIYVYWRITDKGWGLVTKFLRLKEIKEAKEYLIKLDTPEELYKKIQDLLIDEKIKQYVNELTSLREREIELNTTLPANQYPVIQNFIEEENKREYLEGYLLWNSWFNYKFPSNVLAATVISFHLDLDTKIPMLRENKKYAELAKYRITPLLSPHRRYEIVIGLRVHGQLPIDPKSASELLLSNWPRIPDAYKTVVEALRSAGIVELIRPQGRIKFHIYDVPKGDFYSFLEREGKFLSTTISGLIASGVGGAIKGKVKITFAVPLLYELIHTKLPYLSHIKDFDTLVNNYSDTTYAQILDMLPRSLAKKVHEDTLEVLDKVLLKYGILETYGVKQGEQFVLGPTVIQRLPEISESKHAYAMLRALQVLMREYGRKVIAVERHELIKSLKRILGMSSAEIEMLLRNLDGKLIRLLSGGDYIINLVDLRFKVLELGSIKRGGVEVVHNILPVYSKIISIWKQNNKNITVIKRIRNFIKMLLEGDVTDLSMRDYLILHDIISVLKETGVIVFDVSGEKPAIRQAANRDYSQRIIGQILDLIEWLLLEKTSELGPSEAKRLVTKGDEYEEQLVEELEKAKKKLEKEKRYR